MKIIQESRDLVEKVCMKYMNVMFSLVYWLYLSSSGYCGGVLRVSN